MSNDDRMAWKRTPLPWKQITDGDVVDANGQFVDFERLTNGQLRELVIGINARHAVLEDRKND